MKETIEPEDIKSDKKPIHVKPSLYAYYFLQLKEIAEKYGYNLVIHGSMARDLDLIAIPWKNGAHATSIPRMIKEMADKMGGWIMEEKPKPTAYGREQWVININRGGYTDADEFIKDPQYYIDISVIPAEKYKFEMDIVNETAIDFATSVGITEERRIELSKKMDELSASFAGQAIRTCNMFNDILHLCENTAEVVYCVHVHTSWLFERGYMAYVK